MSARSEHGEPVGPLTSVLRHPVLVAVCMALGLALGIATAMALPTKHMAETRVAVVPANSNAYTVAGYPVGARELAADYARWVQNRATDGAWAPSGVGGVTASPIPDSAVIRIEVTAGDEQSATAGAKQIADTLMSTVAEARSGHDPEAAYKQFQDLAPQVAEARAAVQDAERAYGRATAAAARETASEQLQAAQTELAQVQLRQDAAGDLYRRLFVDAAGNSTLEVVAPAASTGDPTRSAMMRYGLIGLGAGGLLGLLVAVLLDRRRTASSRRRAEDATTHG
ncbi:hypothetical protein [Mobilicoccus caccae]|uniref:Capsular polysaccharide biosynthesis protein n=1 Tax=Mobilicoccus caccae TaxID=1859295 RepID=A0ABQ6ILB6_9MICO|nr:hypothetical protein [Mobilicoccus caccae]GMA38727.1 hypothetical protein GCM10025883_07720 [Mobilicoccus caccae]